MCGWGRLEAPTFDKGSDGQAHKISIEARGGVGPAIDAQSLR